MANEFTEDVRYHLPASLGSNYFPLGGWELLGGWAVGAGLAGRDSVLPCPCSEPGSISLRGAWVRVGLEHEDFEVGVFPES